MDVASRPVRPKVAIEFSKDEGLNRCLEIYGLIDLSPIRRVTVALPHYLCVSDKYLLTVSRDGGRIILPSGRAAINQGERDE